MAGDGGLVGGAAVLWRSSVGGLHQAAGAATRSREPAAPAPHATVTPPAHLRADAKARQAACRVGGAAPRLGEVLANLPHTPAGVKKERLSENSAYHCKEERCISLPEKHCPCPFHPHAHVPGGCPDLREDGLDLWQLHAVAAACRQGAGGSTCRWAMAAQACCALSVRKRSRLKWPLRTDFICHE